MHKGQPVKITGEGLYFTDHYGTTASDDPWDDGTWPVQISDDHSQIMLYLPEEITVYADTRTLAYELIQPTGRDAKTFTTELDEQPGFQLVEELIRRNLTHHAATVATLLKELEQALLKEKNPAT